MRSSINFSVWSAGGFAVLGVDETTAALVRGQVDTQLLPSATDDGWRNALLRQAVATGATVEIVEHYDRVADLGGVGALLRYRTADEGWRAGGAHRTSKQEGTPMPAPVIAISRQRGGCHRGPGGAATPHPLYDR